MFDKFFKKAFKSRKTISDEESQQLEEEIERLVEDTKIREVQVVKLTKLVTEDPVNEARYNKRLEIHSRIIKDNKDRILEIEIKLLDN